MNKINKVLVLLFLAKALVASHSSEQKEYPGWYTGTVPPHVHEQIIEYYILNHDWQGIKKYKLPPYMDSLADVLKKIYAVVCRTVSYNKNCKVKFWVDFKNKKFNGLKAFIERKSKIKDFSIEQYFKMFFKVASAELVDSKENLKSTNEAGVYILVE